MTEPDLRRLADTFDSKPSFISLFLDVTNGVDEIFLQKREREITRVIGHNRQLHATFCEGMAQARRVLGKGNWKSHGIALFVSPDKNFSELYDAPVEVGNLMVLDSSPYIRPLVRTLHEWDEYIVIVLDHTHARIFLVTTMGIVHKDTVVEEIVRKHRNGGMSQMRYQRLHDGFVDHYMKEVAEHLGREVEKCHCHGRLRGLVIEGPKDAKREFLQYLTPELSKLVLGFVDIDADAPDSVVVRMAGSLVKSTAQRKESELVDKLKSGIMRHGLVAYGYDEVKELMGSGRVDTVILQKDLVRKGWRCENCRAFGAGELPSAPRGNGASPGSICPSCGAEPLPVDAVEELVEFALDKGAKVEFVPPEGVILELGGIGALLRF